MCDTMVALAGTTAQGTCLFAKNSDREPEEAQAVEIIPGRRYAPGDTVRATYITIPQVERTWTVLLSRPFWIWGAEMGANEHGVVIGNEAIHAVIPPSEEPGLIGMDLLRLALERAQSAAEAVDVITFLLERHGQGGSCGLKEPRYYDNAFLIADPREAFVLEAIGRMWIVQRVNGLRAISNTLNIHHGDQLSRSLGADAAERALDMRFDFAEAYLDPSSESRSFGQARCTRATTLLEARRGVLRPADMMRVLRDHGPQGDPSWHPHEEMGRTICMHPDGAGRRGQTTGSLVSELHEDGTALHWITATAAPCLSLFKPVVLGCDLPLREPAPGVASDRRCLWWRHERLHQAAEDGAFGSILARIEPERDDLEALFAERMRRAMPEGPAARQAAIDWCWTEAEAAEQRWTARFC